MNVVLNVFKLSRILSPFSNRFNRLAKVGDRLLD